MLTNAKPRIVLHQTMVESKFPLSIDPVIQTLGCLAVCILCVCPLFSVLRLKVNLLIFQVIFQKRHLPWLLSSIFLNPAVDIKKL